MTKTITLSDVEITSWSVNTFEHSVTVHYRILEQDGNQYSSGEAVFWETIPQVTDPIQGTPDNWYQLPTKYVQTLTDITNDARTALLQLINY
jgi:hypothetical protein